MARRRLRCRRLRSPVSLVLASVLAVGGCSHAASAPERPRVLAVGDSLLGIADGAMHHELDGSYRLQIEARYGKRIDQLLGPLDRALARGRPDAIVVQLGTNDVIQGVRRPDWRTGWNRLMRDVLPSECVVLTTVSTYLSHWGSHAAEQINAEIFRLEKARSNVQVVDWNKAIHAPDYAGVKKYMSGIPGKLFTDGIHENNGAGARWFATQYRSALARCQLGTGS